MGIDYVKCSCGVYINKVLQEKHMDTVNHKKWFKQHNKYHIAGDNLVECDCGVIVKRKYLYRHFKTIFHKRFLKTGKGSNENMKIWSMHTVKLTSKKPLILQFEYNVVLDFPNL